MRLGRALLTVAAAGIAVLGLASCGKKDSGTKTENYGTLKVAFPAGNIRVAIDIIAESQGFFKDEGVTVEQVAISGQSAIAALQTNELDVLTAGFVPDIQAIAAGTSNLRFIAGTAVEGGAIIAKKGHAAEFKGTGNDPINIDDTYDDDAVTNVEKCLFI